MYVEYSAECPEGAEDEFSGLLEVTMSVIRTRLSDKGYSEATVQRLGDEGIRVEIPDVTDTALVLELIGEPALLEFVTPEGETFMTGEMVSTAKPGLDQSGQAGSLGHYVIQLQLNKEGAQLFKDMTTKYVGRVLYILLDGEVLLAPVVNEPIPGGACTITGMESREVAEKIASQIQSGSLPLVLTQQKLPSGISQELYSCMQFIFTHMNEPISATDVVAFSGKSRAYLFKKFQDGLGISIGAYITECRLREAKSLLRYTDKPLGEISSYLCFSSQSHFQNAFMKHTGVTPNDYRKEHNILNK